MTPNVLIIFQVFKDFMHIFWTQHSCALKTKLVRCSLEISAQIPSVQLSENIAMTEIISVIVLLLP